MAIEIDGSIGEGGGQVLRSSLTLSILTGQPVHLTDIRAGRSQPGLRPQHIQSVKAAAAICNASVEGARLGSQELVFQPAEVSPGKYHFEIGTAGSVSLVLQTIFLPLARADKSSNIRIQGGTHVPWSPSFHYLQLQWLPVLQKMGFRCKLQMLKAGFYPRGGGLVEAHIYSAEDIQPITLIERGQLVRIRGIAGVANLDEEIAHRMKLHALDRLECRWRNTKIQIQTFDAPSPGAFIFLTAEYEKTQCLYCVLGEKGKRAEVVADEACSMLEQFLDGSAAVDEFLADQLLLPCAFASGVSTLRTIRITQHLLTNAQVMQKFLPVYITIEGEIGCEGVVTVTPIL